MEPVLRLKSTRSSTTSSSYLFAELPCWSSLVPALIKSYFWPKTSKLEFHSIFKKYFRYELWPLGLDFKLSVQVQGSTRIQIEVKVNFEVIKNSLTHSMTSTKLPFQSSCDYIICITWKACHVTFGLLWNILIER